MATTARPQAAAVGAGGRSPRTDGLCARVFEGMAAPVILAERTGVEEALRSCLNGWRLRDAAFPTPANPALCAALRDGGMAAKEPRFVFHSPQIETPLDGLSVTGAVCAILADASMGWCAGIEGGMGLHCGAVAFGDRLVAMTGRTRAGKSTLTARLALEPDLPVFCDDVLPVTAGGEGVALGIPPRLRLPLPDGVAPSFRAGVARHAVLADGRYAYLRTPTLAPHGMRARLGALVLLRRGPAGPPARLHRMERIDALYTMMQQTLTDMPTAEAALERAEHLTAGLPALTLVYADLEEAVAVLRRAFAGAAFLPDDLDIGPPLPPEHGADETGAQGDGLAVAPDLVLRPAHDVALRSREGGAFLWRAGSVTLWRLNPVAHAAWAMLDGRTGAGAMAEALAEVFPDTPRQVILGDLCIILGRFLAEGFAEPA